jgi:hypothetical protein
VYRPDPQPTESPRPYIHPLWTLAGDVVTGYRPDDHPWHKGVAVGVPYLSGDNFWGGGTYVAERGGYVPLANHGAMRHDGFDALDADGATFRLVERLTWVSASGEAWLRERREIGVVAVDADAWELGWVSELTVLRAEPLRFGSPTTRGRPLAGYSGLFWRGPRSFTGGRVLGPGGAEGEQLMGQRARWLAFDGRLDGAGRAATLVFVPEAAAGGPPTHWFVRSTDYPGVNPSWSFHEEFPLAQGERLTRGYRIVVATGAWVSSRIESYLDAQRG